MAVGTSVQMQCKSIPQKQSHLQDFNLHKASTTVLTVEGVYYGKTKIFVTEHTSGEIRAVNVNVDGTVAELKKTLEYIFGVPAQTQTLVLGQKKKSGGSRDSKPKAIKLETDSATLASYGVQQLSVILMKAGTQVLISIHMWMQQKYVSEEKEGARNGTAKSCNF